MVLQEHDNASTADQAAKWEEQRQVSHYAANLAQLEVGLGRHGRQIPSDPSLWVCDETGVKENLWLNLSTGFIGSGRQVCIMPVMLGMYVAAVACILEAGTRCKNVFSTAEYCLSVCRQELLQGGTGQMGICVVVLLNSV